MGSHDSGQEDLQQLHKTLIAGSHILHYHHVLDAYGHISVRHPSKPDVFIMSRSVAPANIASAEDLIEYYVSNAEPVDPTATGGYAERCIHSECYKRFAGISSVIHSHSEAVVPYSVSQVPLRPLVHVAGFLSSNVPVFEISEAYRDGDEHDLLVTKTHLGNAMAAKLGQDGGGLPAHPMVLMRGHGFTIVGNSIQDAVVRAVYTQKNALIQTTALTTALAAGGRSKDIRYLSEDEIIATSKVMKWSAYRPWALWLREVEAANLYVNSA